MGKILFTGFEPFGNERLNASWMAVSNLPDRILDYEVYVRKLPTVFHKAPLVLETYIEELCPDIVICVGQSGGSSEIEIERVAINLSDARIPDNEGQIPQDEKILSQGNNAYFATIPTRKIVERMQEFGIPSKLSYSAGTYVCNEVLYSALYMAETKYPDMQCGFVHVPYVKEQTVDKPDGTPCMECSMITDALKEIVQCL